MSTVKLDTFLNKFITNDNVEYTHCKSLDDFA